MASQGVTSWESTTMPGKGTASMPPLPASSCLILDLCIQHAEG